MEKDKFEANRDKYKPIFKPIITKFIEDNYKYYQVSKIIWWFTWIDDISIMGECNRNNNLVKLNLKAVIDAFENGNFHDVEYFVNHEIRHIFQHIKIKELDERIENGVDKKLIKQTS